MKQNEKLKIEYVGIDEVKPYKNDAKKHPPEQIEQIKKSIEQFGMDDPIGVWKDEIVEGHGRLIACKELGFTEIPIIRLDHLTDEERKAYTLAHNKLTMNSDFDLDILNDELMSFDTIDMSDFGFDIDLSIDDEETEIIEDEVPEVPEEPKAKLGDIYQLGNHRLMCGDSTKEEDVAKLMNGVKADMVFTDPPYGVAYTGGLQFKDGYVEKNNREMIKNDDVDIYDKVFPIISKFCNGACYIWFAGTKAKTLYESAEKYGDIHSLIIWVKNGGYGALNANYKQKHEPCLYWTPKGCKTNFIGKTTETTVWEINKDGVNEFHPTQKPIILCSKAISNHKADIVLDLFGGSGSTLIACEQLNRKCYMMELDPKYVDVIIDRWETFTGKKAIKIGE